MAAVPIFLIGVFAGALLRPVLDAYLGWRTARLYASLPDSDEVPEETASAWTWHA